MQQKIVELNKRGCKEIAKKIKKFIRAIIKMFLSTEDVTNLPEIGHVSALFNAE